VRWNWWRIGTPVAVLLSGALFAVSADNSQGTDLRPGRYTDLSSLVSSEAREYAALRQRVTDLNADIAVLTNSVNDRDVQRFQRRIEKLEDPAGLTPRTGPGITVTLSDAPEEVVAASDQDLNLLVVHQQDIQAVVNALWQAAPRGHRAGPAVSPRPASSARATPCSCRACPTRSPTRSPPSATRPRMRRDRRDAYLQLYREQAAQPDIAVGWELRSRTRSPLRRTTASWTSTTRSRCAEPPLRPRSAGAGRDGRVRRRRVGDPWRRRRSGTGVGSRRERSRRLGRLHERGDHDRHRRALGGGLAVAGLWSMTVPFGSVVLSDSTTSAGTPPRAPPPRRPAAQSDDVGTSSGPSERTPSPAALGHLVPAGRVGLDDLAAGASDVRSSVSRSLRPSSVGPGLVAALPDTRAPVIGLARRDDEVDLRVGVDELVRLGSWLMTRPGRPPGRPGVDAPHGQPASPISARACCSVSPIRLGTWTCSGAVVEHPRQQVRRGAMRATPAGQGDDQAGTAPPSSSSSAAGGWPWVVGRRSAAGRREDVVSGAAGTVAWTGRAGQVALDVGAHRGGDW
jgi:hypothetical protein